MSNVIDFVIPWVDCNDPTWQVEKKRFSQKSTGDNRVNRYRDWDNLQYWFRGVEKFAPWVNKIHFITWGHIPTWLNQNHPNLRVVRHDDFIPHEYLPTFSANTIELNLHRIKDLKEQFVYFNDDTFILKKMSSEDYFRQGLPCDSAVLMPSISSFRNSIGGMISNNMEIINTTFEKSKVIRKNFRKWFHPIYNKHLISTILMMSYTHFAGFLNIHIPNSFLKETFSIVWEAESDVLDQTCRRRFRDCKDVNQWLFRYWQLVTGKFYPRSVSIGKYYSLTNNNEQIIKAIKNQKYKMVCLNDDNRDPILDFNGEKKLINDTFAKILPNKSTYEK